MLTEGIWSTGEQLPTEAELSEMFGVSRMTVRMAIQKLSACGLVTTRAGEGSYVRAFSLQDYLAAAKNFYVTPEMLDDVCEFRKLLEVECARLACQRATEEDLQLIQRACDEYHQVIVPGAPLTEENLNLRVKADLDFHYSICLASHNSMYVLAFTAARGAIAQHLKNIIPSRILERPNLDYVSDGRTAHQYILDTIRKRDVRACLEAYLPHIDHRFALEELEKILQSISTDKPTSKQK